MNMQNGEVRIRWLEDEPPGPDGVRGDRLYSHVTLPADSPQPGAIEISEALARERAHMRSELGGTLELTFAMVICAALLSAWLGYRLIGVPLHRLAEKARRVGQGDLDQPLMLPQTDELG